jgi:Protein of unknown function (DUF2786).
MEWQIITRSRKAGALIDRLKKEARQKTSFPLNDVFFARIPSSRLGYFDNEQDIIVLNEVLLYETEETVRQVFLHELAHLIHKYVSGYGIHDDDFSRICASLGVDPAFSGARVREARRFHTAEKIKKLIALSSSPCSAEAESAMRKARSLMTETALEEDTEPTVSEVVIHKGGTIPTHIKTIAQMAALVSGAFVVSARNNQGERVLYAFGGAEMLEVFTYLYDCFSRSTRAAFDTYCFDNAIKGNKRLYTDYVIGVYTSLEERLKPKPQEAECRALVTVRNEVKKRTLEIKWPGYVLRSSRSGERNTDWGTYSGGREYGKSMPIHPGIRNRSGNTRLLDSKNQ